MYAGGPSRSFLVNRPEYVRHVLVDRADDYSKDTPINAGFATTIADGLLTSEGDVWRRQRTLMQPAFARRNIPALAEVVTTLVEQMVERWTSSGGEQADIDLSAEMSQLLFRVTAVALFHVDTSPWDGRTVELLTGALPVLCDLSAAPFLEAQAAIWDLAARIVDERLKQGDGVFDDVFSALMESGTPDADPAALRDQVVTLALAGYETTASVVTWACYVLAKRPDIASVLRAQIDAAVGDRPVTIADLPALPYLTAVVKETLRLYPPAWIIGRRALRPDRVGETEIPTHSVVAISPYVLHRNPAYWDDPETFDPGRFLDRAEHRRHPFSYIPFGAGPRTCVGVNFALIEAPLIIGMLTQRFRMTLASDSDVQPHGIFVLVPREPIRMRLQAA